MYKIKETTDERLTFLVTIPVHEGCGESSETDLLGSETHNESSERKEISSETTSKSSERNVDTIKDVYYCTLIKKRSGDSPLRLYL